MKSPVRTLFLSLAAMAASLQAGEMFPLQPGSVWEYRANGVAVPLVISVGHNQLYVQGNVYARLKGYVNEPVWARMNDSNELVYLDEETGREALLTSFALTRDAWFNAPLRTCEQDGQAHSDEVPFSSVVGRIPKTLAVRYRTYGCADAGLEAELFADNVGMVSRIVSTIAGPLRYDLVYADTRALQLAPRQGTTLRLALERIDETSANARLRLSGDPEETAKLRFAGARGYDMALRNEQGELVWRLSDGLVDIPVVFERDASNLFWETVVPIPTAGGKYMLEAWLDTVGPNQAFRVATPMVVIGSEQPSPHRRRK